MSTFGLIGSADLKKTMDKMSKFHCDDYLIVTREMTVEDVLKETFINNRQISVIELLSFNDLELSNSQMFVLFNELLDKGISIQFIEKIVDISDEEYLAIIYLVLQRDYEFRSRTQKEKLQEARENGVQLGRPGLTDQEIANIMFLRKEQKLTYREIASQTGISLGTVAKYSKQEGAKKMIKKQF